MDSCDGFSEVSTCGLELVVSGVEGEGNSGLRIDHRSVLDRIVRVLVGSSGVVVADKEDEKKIVANVGALFVNFSKEVVRSSVETSGEVEV